MAGSIGKGSLILTTDGAKLDAGLSGAHAKITSWADKLKGGLGGIGASITGKLGLGGVAGAFGKLAGPVGAIGTAVFAAVKEGVDTITDGLKEIAAYGKSARSLGVDPSEFMGLAKAAERAGLELPEFTAILGKLQAKIATGGKDTADALAGIGLNVSALQSGSVADAFFQIADGLARTGDAGVRSGTALKLFEEAGLKLLPVLRRGQQGLQEFISEQRRAGAVLSNEQIAAAAAASKAVNDAKAAIETAFTGLWNRILVTIAPALAKIANLLESGFKAMQPIFDFFAGAFTAVFRAVAVTGAYAFDAVKAAIGGVIGALSLAVDGAGLFVRVTKNVVSVGGYLPEWLGGGVFEDATKAGQEMQDWLENRGKSMRDFAKASWNGFGSSAKRIGEWFDRVKEKKDAAFDAEDAIGQMSALTNAAGKISAGKKDDFGPIIKGTKEDYQLRVRFEADRKTEGEKLLGEMQKGNRLNERQVEKLTGILDSLAAPGVQLELI